MSLKWAWWENWSSFLEFKSTNAKMECMFINQNILRSFWRSSSLKIVNRSTGKIDHFFYKAGNGTSNIYRGSTLMGHGWGLSVVFLWFYLTRLNIFLLCFLLVFKQSSKLLKWEILWLLLMRFAYFGLYNPKITKKVFGEYHLNQRYFR